MIVSFLLWERGNGALSHGSVISAVQLFVRHLNLIVFIKLIGNMALKRRYYAYNHPQVIEYLSKKGYSKTEATLRAESASQDAEGRPLPSKTEDIGGIKYRQGFGQNVPDPPPALRL